MYELKKISTDITSLEYLTKLLKQVYPSNRFLTTDYLRWQYVDNPVGEAIGYNAFYNGHLVAHYVVLPIELKIHGNIVKAALSLNTATHPSHQGKGLFTKLAEATYEEAESLGKQVIIGVANANSTPGFVKKLGFDLISPLGAKITTNSGPKKYEEYNFQRYWTKSSLAWRLNNPSRQYSSVHKKETASFFAPTNRYGIQAIMGKSKLILDNKLIKFPFFRNPFNLWIGICNEYENSKGVISIPDYFKPSPLNFIFKSIDSRYSKPDKSDIFFQLLDFDAY